ncbi:MAG: hypothetical protein M3132_05065 [Actinomycetia bacterium]|nr:hypothetical protein [Actinomycetes bacterium]
MEHVYIGHFLTRIEAARRLGVPSQDVSERDDLLRVGGTWLEEVYFEFQFTTLGFRDDLGRIVRELRRTFDDVTISDWLAQPNRLLRSASPLQWLASDLDVRLLSRAATVAGPV